MQAVVAASAIGLCSFEHVMVSQVGAAKDHIGHNTRHGAGQHEGDMSDPEQRAAKRSRRAENGNHMRYI